MSRLLLTSTKPAPVRQPAQVPRPHVHHLHFPQAGEVFKITDRISVLRDGKDLGTYEARETTPRAIVGLIAGRELLIEIEKSAASGAACDEPGDEPGSARPAAGFRHPVDGKPP
jgi:hypothetical protein